MTHNCVKKVIVLLLFSISSFAADCKPSVKKTEYDGHAVEIRSFACTGNAAVYDVEIKIVYAVKNPDGKFWLKQFSSALDGLGLCAEDKKTTVLWCKALSEVERGNRQFRRAEDALIVALFTEKTGAPVSLKIALQESDSGTTLGGRLLARTASGPKAKLKQNKKKNSKKH